MRRRGVCLLVVFGLLGLLGLLGLCGLSRPAAAEPPHTHEILSHRPSGFWTSNVPAQGGAYRWRLLGIGCVVLVATGYFTWRIVKRASASRS